MSENRNQWVIRAHTGKITGPYSTQEVFRLISEGRLQGDEKLAKYPGGDWMLISQEESFYDKLLESLSKNLPTQSPQNFNHEPIQEKNNLDLKSKDSNSQSEENDFEKTIAASNNLPVKEKTFEETVIRPPPPAPLEPRSSSQLNTKSLMPVPTTQPSPPAQLTANDSSGTLANRKKGSPVIPLLILIAGLSVIAYYFLDLDETSAPENSQYISLRVPKETQLNLSKEELAKRQSDALSAFNLDTTENYNRAQNEAAVALEAVPGQMGLRGMICLSYLYLWPHTKQDSADLLAVNTMTQRTRSVDPLSAYGYVCEISKLLIAGKLKDAKGMVENTLNDPNYSGVGVLYELLTEILVAQKDFATAEAYAKKAVASNGEWLRPHMSLARAYEGEEKYKEAFDELQGVVAKSPNHREALGMAGVIAYKKLHDSENAISILSQFSQKKDRVGLNIELGSYLVMSEIYIEKGQKEQALTFAKKAFEVNPSSPEAKDLLARLGAQVDVTKISPKSKELVFLGDQYFMMGDWLAAQAQYKAAFDLDVTNALAAMKAARALWNLHQEQDSLNWLNKSVKADPKLSQAATLLADYLSKRYNYQGAVQALNKAASSSGASNEIYRGYALVEFRRNNFGGAVSYGLRALKLYDRDVESMILLAKSYLGMHDSKEANRYAISALELENTNVEANIVYAKIKAEVAGADAGLTYLQSQVTKYPYTLEYRMAMAELNKEQDRIKQAQAIYEQIVDADPKNERAFLGLGECYQAQLLNDKALKTYLTASVIDPSDAEPLFKAGNLYLDKSMYDEAMKQYKRVIDINPYYPRALSNMAKAIFLKAEMFPKNPDGTVSDSAKSLYTEGLKILEKEKSLNPGLAESYMLSGDIYKALHQYAKCAGEYQGAIRIRADSADLYVSLARCHRLAGNFDVARAMLEVAASKESGNADVWKEQGAIFESQKDRRAAVLAYQRYLALSPNAPDRHEIEMHIIELNR